MSLLQPGLRQTTPLRCAKSTSGLSPITKRVIQVVCLLLSAAGLGLIAYSRNAATWNVVPAAPRDFGELSPQTSSGKEMSEVGFLGVVVATHTVDLAPKVNGRVDAVHVRLGDRVIANAPIATLDTAALRHDLKMGEAKLGIARAEAAKSETELRQLDDELEAFTTLSQSGNVSAKELSAAQHRNQAASASLEAARARVSEAEAQVLQLKQTLADAYIRAPFAGVISDRFVDPGAMVGPSVPIARLVSADNLRVRFAVPEQMAGGISTGMAVQAWVSATGTQLSGVVENVAPEVDIASRMIIAEAKLDPTEAKKAIPSGAVARVSIIAPIHTGAR